MNAYNLFCHILKDVFLIKMLFSTPWRIRNLPAKDMRFKLNHAKNEFKRVLKHQYSL